MTPVLPATMPVDPADRRWPGSRIVIGLLLLAVALAAFAVWFQWRQTRRCLRFYGPAVARAIQAAPRVELWRIAVDPVTGRLVTTERRDISKAKGLVHLRRGLVEDANFAWEPTGDGRLPVASWDVALAFLDETAGRPVVLACDLDDAGSLTVVGRPGRIGLGRLGPGLRKWLEATASDSH